MKRSLFSLNFLALFFTLCFFTQTLWSQEQGNQTVQFNASTLASGLYIMRIQITEANGNSKVLTKNLTLIK